jgi:hypothetical protein
MSAQDLKELLEEVEDTREIVIWLPAGSPAGRTGELVAVWAAARAEANCALDAWREAPGRDAYAVYLAAEDRADAAELALTA